MSKILVIDDDGPFRTMLRKALVKLGHEVTEAANGREAARLFAAEPADLVLTDLIMPEQEGLETIRYLRKNNPTLKIVAMSGGGRINARDFLPVARHLGADRTLLKPFSNQEMAAMLSELLAPAR